MQHGVVGLVGEEHLERVRLVVPVRNADGVYVAREVGDLRLQLGECCNTHT